jgi:hypothetical protein
MPCATSLMSINIQTKSVVISSAPHSDLIRCSPSSSFVVWGIIAVVAALFLAVHHQTTDVKDLFLRLFSPSSQGRALP